MSDSIIVTRPAAPVPSRLERIAQCENVTRTGGLAAGLATALTGVDPACAPGGVAALPRSTVAAEDLVIADRIAGLEQIALVVPCSAEKSAEKEYPTDILDDAEVLVDVAAGLGAVRLVLAEQLLDQAVAHLSGRIAGGEAIIRKQMIVAAEADARTAITALRHLLRLPYLSIAVLAGLHEQVTELGWEIAKLLGASGFLATGPARVLHVSRLVANCWVATGTPATGSLPSSDHWCEDHEPGDEDHEP